MTKIVGIIPSRYASTRFPAKPLAKIGGKSMINRVYDQCKKAKSLTEVVVATDHEAIADDVKSFGGKVVMTNSNHPSGTDRCFEAYQKLNWRLGIKNDVWKNNVTWTTDGQSDDTDILVIQPTAELSYVWLKSNFVIAPSVAFGLEWNVETKGEPTGEGPILLVGIQLGHRF